MALTLTPAPSKDIVVISRHLAPDGEDAILPNYGLKYDLRL